MKKSVLLIVIFYIALASSQVFAQNSNNDAAEAKDTLIKFIQLSDQQALQEEQARQLLAGEALTRWKTPSFGRLSKEPDKIILPGPNFAVGRIQAFGENNFIGDLYFYLEKNSAWKITAMRTLAMTGMIEDINHALKAKKTLTEEEASVLANTELVLATDSSLAEWFSQHHESLDQLYTLTRSKVKIEPKVSAGIKFQYIGSDDKQFPEIAQKLKQLHFSGINITPEGNYEFVIGGMLDNTVGFLYSPNKTPPSISPSEYIWVEELTGYWYLFRTT